MNSSRVYVGVNELSRRYAKEHGVTIKEAHQIIKNVSNLMEDVLLDSTNDGILLIDFLTLQKVERTYVNNRNPKTGEQFPDSIKTEIKLSKGKAFDLKLNPRG